MDDRQAPVREGEEHTVSIRSVGEKGDGIAKINGFVIFVAGTKKNDYVKVKITKVLKSVAFATVVEKLERPQRTSKYVTVDPNEPTQEEKFEEHEETEDFGDDLDEEDY